MSPGDLIGRGPVPLRLLLPPLVALAAALLCACPVAASPCGEGAAPAAHAVAGQPGLRDR